MFNLQYYLYLSMLLFSLTVKGQGISFSQTYSTAKPEQILQKGNFIAALDGLGAVTNSMYRKRIYGSIAPSAGYFIADRMAAGVRLSYGKDGVGKKEGIPLGTSVLEYSHRSLAPELFLRYYVTRYRIKPFIQLSTGYNFQWGETENSNGSRRTVSASNAIGNAQGGLFFLLGKRLSIDVMYSQRIFSKSSLNDANEKTKLRLGLSWNFH